MVLKSTIQSILFIAGRPVSLKELAHATGNNREDVQKALNELVEEHRDSGFVILRQNENYLMSSNPESSEVVKEFLNLELREKLTDAAIETLAIIAYKQPVSRAEIEAIRGVNSQYTIRLLMMRGLIEKTAGKKDSRISLFQTTHEFLQYLGIKDAEDLPEFTELAGKIKPPDGFLKPDNL